MCWHRTDPLYTQRPARGRRYQAVDGCDRTGGLANHVSASRLGFFPCNLTHFQIQILCKQLRSNRTSFTRQPPVQRHLTGSAPGQASCFSSLSSVGSDWLCLVNNSGAKHQAGNFLPRHFPPSVRRQTDAGLKIHASISVWKFLSSNQAMTVADRRGRCSQQELMVRHDTEYTGTSEIP